MRKLSPNAYKMVADRNYGTPKKLWGFQSDPGDCRAEQVAFAFLEANRESLGIELGPLLEKAPPVLQSLGAKHVIVQQRWQRHRIQRAYVTVHLGIKDRRFYLAKSRAVPREVLEKARLGRVTLRAVHASLTRVCARGHCHVVGHPELTWFPAKRLLYPAKLEASASQGRCQRSRLANPRMYRLQKPKGAKYLCYPVGSPNC